MAALAGMDRRATAYADRVMRPPAAHGPRFRRFVFGVAILVAWAPGAVALAMLLTGNAG